MENGRHKVAANVFRLGDVADFEALKLNRITAVESCTNVS